MSPAQEQSFPFLRGRITSLPGPPASLSDLFFEEKTENYSQTLPMDFCISCPFLNLVMSTEPVNVMLTLAGITTLFIFNLEAYVSASTCVPRRKQVKQKVFKFISSFHFHKRENRRSLTWKIFRGAKERKVGKGNKLC